MHSFKGLNHSVDATTLYFDFAHALTMPFFVDMENLKIYHFSSKDTVCLGPSLMA